MKAVTAAIIVLSGWAATSVRANTTIDPVNRYAWGANIGWIDWHANGANGAVIGQNFCSGYIYSANCGWINLGSGSPANGVSYQNNSGSDFGVNVDNSGNLRGYAWGANIGWINFEDTGAPAVNLATGQFSGYAWSANCGWINLSSGYGVQTTSQPATGTHQTQISTVGVWDGSTAPPASTDNQFTPPYQTFNSIGNLAAGTTTGEAFIAPAGVTSLNYFTFYLQGSQGSQITFQGEVFNWFGSLIDDGSNPGPYGGSALPQGTTSSTVDAPPTGTVTALYTSPAINYTASGGWDAVTISIPGGVSLTPGNAYVIDLTATGGTGSAVFGNTWLYLFGGLGAPTQGGVNFSYAPGNEFGAWNEPGFGFFGDLAFSAGFSGGTYNTVALTASSGNFTVEFVGIPGATYVIQEATAVTGPWVNLSGDLIAAPDGTIQYSDTTPMQAERYYRAQYISGP
jgi:hypothetical protein